MAERQPEDAHLVLTVGNSTRTFGQFAGLLRAGGVERLVDVRRFPHSPRHPQSAMSRCRGGCARAGPVFCTAA